MQSKAATVSDYLASLPDDRRKAIEAVRSVILANLDKDFEEGMQYGMIGYYVPTAFIRPAITRIRNRGFRLRRWRRRRITCRFI